MFFYVFMTHSPTTTLCMVGAFSFFPTHRGLLAAAFRGLAAESTAESAAAHAAHAAHAAAHAQVSGMF